MNIRAALILVLALGAMSPGGGGAMAQEIPPPETREVPLPPEAEEPEAGDEGEWELVEAIVAWVNDDIITTSDLVQAERELTAQFYRELTGEELEKALADLQDQLLYRLIEDRLLVQQAEQLYDMTKVRQTLLDQLKKQQGIDSEEMMNQFLRQAGMTQEELIDLLVDQNVATWVVQAEVTDNISASNEEVETYFEEHRDELGEQGQVTFREIVLKDDGTDPEAVRRRANQTVADARAGIDYLELVQAVSESPSREGGGLVGPIALEDLAPWLAEVALQLPPGEISDPIRTDFGWQVIQVEERTEARPPDLETMRGKVELLVREGKYRPALETYISGLWSDSEIYLGTPYLEWLPAPWRERVRTRP